MSGESRHRRVRRGSAAIAALLLLSGAALAWVGRSPWWAWVAIIATVAATSVAIRLLSSRGRLIRAGAWVAGAALVMGTAIGAPPSLDHRLVVEAGVLSDDTVETSEGPVRGVIDVDAGVEAFAGIPYAQPPVGDLRWREPHEPEPHRGVFVADRFSDVAVQASPDFIRRALPTVVPVPMLEELENRTPMSEDSLTLNIWRSTRPAEHPLPIFVYIHGGGFQGGSGAVPLYDGAALASRGEAIVVTINYRVGVFGYMSHPELAAESPNEASGMYGTLDQLAALRWLDDNAAAFGGDASRITIGGESAGGEAVCILGATALAKGLVDGIIAGSGACMGTAGDTEQGDQIDSREAAEQAGQRLSEALGGATIEEMRAMSAEELQAASTDLAAHWRPSTDGHVLDMLPADIYATGGQLDVPLLLGSNADEASVGLAAPGGISLDEFEASARDLYGEDAERFLDLYPAATDDEARLASMQADTDRVMTRSMYRWASLHTDTASAPAFLYFFAHTPPSPGLERFGAYHGAEIPYAFDNLDAVNDLLLAPADLTLRDQMSSYWLNFIATGDPGGAMLPPWSDFRSEPDGAMRFENGSEFLPHPRPEQVDFWMEYEGPIA
nr:carboxylesterase family protein [uncultured Microbacterium sp.]